MGGGSSPPPAPDYAAAAEKTAAGNLELARTTTQANRVNTFTPYGSLTYSQPGRTFDQAGYDAAMARYNTPTAAVPGTPATGSGGTSSSGVGDAWDGSVSGEAATPGTPASPTTGAMPNREDFMRGDADAWEAQVKLDPVQQQLLDQQNKTSMGLSQLQDSATSRVASSMNTPFSLGGAPSRASAYSPVQGPSTYTPSSSLGGGDIYTPKENLPGTFSASNGLTAANLAAKFSMTGTPAGANADSGELTKADVYKGGGPSLSKYYDPTRDTGVATDQLMHRMNPALDRDEAAMRTRLSNMGLTPGSEAWKAEMEAAGQRRNDATMQASLQGINLGMAQQGQTFGQTSKDAQMELDRQRQTNEQQRANEALRLAQFQAESNVELGNSRIAADSQASAAANQLAAARLEMDQQALKFNQGTTNIGTGMAQQGQQFNQKATTVASNAAQQGQQFDQGMANVKSIQAQQAQQFAQAEALRQGFTQDQLLMRSQPLNELNAIRTGAQVQNPTFPTIPGQANVGGPNYMGAAQSQYGAAMDAYSASQAADNSMMQGAVGVASVAAMAF
jgi:hypothetical protein